MYMYICNAHTYMYVHTYIYIYIYIYVHNYNYVSIGGNFANIGGHVLLGLLVPIPTYIHDICITIISGE